MAYATDTVTNEAPAMICPVCGKSFFDVHALAAHINEHSQEEKKRKADEEKKRRDEERSKDIDNLIALKTEADSADKRFAAAMEDYKKKYGGLVFPYTNDAINDLLFNVCRWI